MEEKIKRLEVERDLLFKEVKRLKELSTKGEKVWENVLKFGGLLVMFFPFVPSAFYYLGFRDIKTPLETGDWMYVAAGAILVFGQKYLGELLNSLGKKILGKS